MAQSAGHPNTTFVNMSTGERHALYYSPQAKHKKGKVRCELKRMTRQSLRCHASIRRSRRLAVIAKKRMCEEPGLHYNEVSLLRLPAERIKQADNVGLECIWSEYLQEKKLHREAQRWMEIRWYMPSIRSSSLLAQHAVLATPKMLWKGGDLIRVLLCIEQDVVFLQGFWSRIASDEAIQKLATKSECAALKGLASASLIALLRYIVSRGFATHGTSLSLDASGRIPGKSMSGLLHYYHSLLGVRPIYHVDSAYDPYVVKMKGKVGDALKT